MGEGVMPSRFKHYPARPTHTHCANAFVILCNAHDASSSFLDAFTTVRQNRHARGTPTDEEQDLLRAMLIFASAGLDSMVKQLVKDALPCVIECDQGAARMFKIHVQRQLKRDEANRFELLADVIADAKPREKLVCHLVSELTADSLQSTKQLMRVASFFNIPSRKLASNLGRLSDIFDARNQISHEMDVDFAQPNRNRRPRARERMLEFTNEVFGVANAFLGGVDRQLG